MKNKSAVREVMAQGIAEFDPEYQADSSNQRSTVTALDMAKPHNLQRIVGESCAVKEALSAAARVAPTAATVLIRGETGTGKGLIAELIHHLSTENDGPFVKVNCAGLPSGLVESTLFGHERGSFTGAHATRLGAFEEASGGTIFLDEIGDLPIEHQGTLLRVLEDHEITRVGASRAIRANSRVIAATNRCLETDVKEGRFRADLFFRLNVFPIELAKLAHRIEDIEPLSRFFLDEAAQRHSKIIETIPATTMKTFENHDWPGNVRELKTVIERSVIMSDGPELIVDQSYFSQGQKCAGGLRTLDEITKESIEETLYRTSWKIEGPDGAAKLLGLKPSTLRWRLKKLGIRRPTTNGIGANAEPQGAY